MKMKIATRLICPEMSRNIISITPPNQMGNMTVRDGRVPCCGDLCYAWIPLNKDEGKCEIYGDHIVYREFPEEKNEGLSKAGTNNSRIVSP